jgi:hypothetical protein
LPTQLGDPLRVTHAYIEHIAMEYPRLFTVQFQHHLIVFEKVANALTAEFLDKFIVISRNVNHLYALREHVRYFFDHADMILRKIALAELPDIDDVTVQDQFFRADALQVAHQFLCMAAIRAKVRIADNHGFNGASVFKFHVFGFIGLGMSYFLAKRNAVRIIAHKKRRQCASSLCFMVVVSVTCFPKFGGVGFPFLSVQDVCKCGGITALFSASI